MTEFYVFMAHYVDQYHKHQGFLWRGIKINDDLSVDVHYHSEDSGAGYFENKECELEELIREATALWKLIVNWPTGPLVQSLVLANLRTNQGAAIEYNPQHDVIGPFRFHSMFSYNRIS